MAPLGLRSYRLLGCLLLFSVTGSGLPLGSGEAATRVVTSLADPGIRGCTPRECTLREAVVAAQPRDTITFASRLFTNGPATITLAQPLRIDKSVTITGPGQNRLAISGNQVTRVFAIAMPPGDTVTLQRLTITQGKSAYGGGIYCHGGPDAVLRLDRITVSGNQAVNGGGLYLGARVGMRLQQSTIRGNTATGDGGGLYKESDSFYFFDADTTITRSLIETNTAEQRGGGVYYDSPSFSPTHALTESTIRKNTATWGGGIYSWANLALTRSTIHQNTARQGGGGIYGELHDTTTLTQSTVSANVATWGGGIYYAARGFSSVVVLWQSDVSNNRAHESGGGIYTDGTTQLTESTLSANRARFGGGLYNNPGEDVVTVTRSTVRDNTAVNGGGVYNDTAYIAFNTSTISGNTATANGGGIYFHYEGAGYVTLEASTVSVNTAVRHGGGVYANDPYNYQDSPLTFKNTILAGNTAGTAGTGDCALPINSSNPSWGTNLLGAGTGCPLQTNQGDISVDPSTMFTDVLGPLQDNGGATFTHALLPESPALERADRTMCGGTDQRGVPRPQPQGAACDIGAFELEVP